MSTEGYSNFASQLNQHHEKFYSTTLTMQKLYATDHDKQLYKTLNGSMNMTRAEIEQNRSIITHASNRLYQQATINEEKKKRKAREFAKLETQSLQ